MAKRKKAKRVKVVVVVRGGAVQAAYSNNKSIDFVLMDWDNIDEGDPYPESFGDGASVKEFLSRIDTKKDGPYQIF
jgi:hypothetical protein